MQNYNYQLNKKYILIYNMKESTKKSYESRIRALERKYPDKINELWTCPISEIECISTRNHMISALKYKYPTQAKNLDIQEVVSPTHKLTEKEETHWISWDDVENKLNELRGLRSMSTKDHRKYILLLLYAKVAALRSEYHSMVTHKSPDRNYICINDDNTISIKLYKHKNDWRYIYDETFNNISDQTVDDIRQWISLNNSYTNKYLFPSRNSSIGLNSTREILNDIFSPKKVGSRLFRKIKATANNPWREDNTPNELGHTRSIHDIYYRKEV